MSLLFFLMAPLVHFCTSFHAMSVTLSYLLYPVIRTQIFIGMLTVLPSFPNIFILLLVFLLVLFQTLAGERQASIRI